MNFMGSFRGHVIIAEKLLEKNDCYEIAYSFGDCNLYLTDKTYYMHLLNTDKIIDFFKPSDY